MFDILGRVATTTYENPGDDVRGWRTKVAQDKGEVLHEAYLAGFYGYFDKTASDTTSEYIVASDLGTRLGLELVGNLIESTQLREGR